MGFSLIMGFLAILFMLGIGCVVAMTILLLLNIIGDD
jgi:hypothetical protein